MKKTCLSKGTGSALKGNRLRKNSRTYVQISICLGKASKKSPKPSTKVIKILPNGAKRLLNGATWAHQELPKGSSGAQLGQKKSKNKLDKILRHPKTNLNAEVHVRA